MAENLEQLTGICRRILTWQNPWIVIHARPDGDAVGSAFALARLLRLTGRRPYVVCSDPVPERLSFLTDGQPDVSAALAPACDGIISVDVAAPSQLGELQETLTGRVDLMIDHHGRGTAFAPLTYVDPDASASGEIVFAMAEILHDLTGVLPDAETALRLYAAIASDTGSFKYANTTPTTMRRAAALLESGFDHAAVAHLLFDSKSRNALCGEKLAYEKMRWFDNGRVTAAVITNADKEQAGVTDSDLETAIDIVRSSAGAAVSFTVREAAAQPGEFRVSLRAADDTDVSAVAAAFGGGGHRAAAGCSVPGADGEEALQKVLGVLHRQKKP